MNYGEFLNHVLQELSVKHQEITSIVSLLYRHLDLHLLLLSLPLLQHPLRLLLSLLHLLLHLLHQQLPFLEVVRSEIKNVLDRIYTKLVEMDLTDLLGPLHNHAKLAFLVIKLLTTSTVIKK